MPSRVAVTGGSGYVGGALVHSLLTRGYTVVALVRDPLSASVAHLNQMRNDHADQLSIADVPMLSLECPALSAAFQGCSTIFHTASPINESGENISEEDFVAAASEISIAVLHTAAAVGVSRVVMTSSMAAVTNGSHKSDPSIVYAEHHWSDTNPAPLTKYPRSKVLAERAAWSTAADLPLTLAVINPSLVLGPPIPCQPPRSSNIILFSIANGSSRNTLAPGALPNDRSSGPPSGVCHVGDVVDAHIAVAEVEAAGGERYVVSCRNQFSTLEIAEAVGKIFTGLASIVPQRFADDVSDDVPRAGRKPANDPRKIEALLGRKLRGLDVIVEDGVVEMARLKLLPPDVIAEVMKS